MKFSMEENMKMPRYLIITNIVLVLFLAVVIVVPLLTSSSSPKADESSTSTTKSETTLKTNSSTTTEPAQAKVNAKKLLEDGIVAINSALTKSPEANFLLISPGVGNQLNRPNGAGGTPGVNFKFLKEADPSIIWINDQLVNSTMKPSTISLVSENTGYIEFQAIDAGAKKCYYVSMDISGQIKFANFRVVDNGDSGLSCRSTTAISKWDTNKAVGWG